MDRDPSEDAYEALVRHAMDGVLLTEPDGRILAANPAACELLGRSEAEICRIGRAGVLAPSSPELAGALDERTRAGRVSVELTFVRGDGTRFPGEVTSATFVDRAGQPRTAMILRDVTVRRQAEERLRASESHFRTLATMAPVGIFRSDAQGRCVFVNDRWCDYAGLTPAQAMGDGWSAAVHPDDRAWVSRAWHDAAGGRGSFNGEYRFQRPDGRVTWVVGTAAAAWDEQGEFLGHVGTITDITERRQTEERLRASEARFRGLIDSSPVPYALNDAALRITYLNPAFVRMFGYDRHDIPTVDDWWPRAYPDEGYRRRVEADWMERLDRSRRDGGTFEPMEVKIRCKDGADRVAVVSPHAIGDGLDGTYAVVLHDVTERRQLEEARLRSQRLESLGTLAGGVAHDFNNILTAIVGHTELAIADADPNSPVGEALAAVHVASLRAVELVRRITSFAGPKERSPTSLQLGHVVEEVLRLLRSTTSPSISLRTVFARDVPAARADAAQVHEALVNLTTNAVYAIGSRPGQIEYLLDAVDVGGTTAARLGLTPGAYVRLTVKDDGVGIDPAALGRIFDAFFTTKPTGQGSGLGLSMVYGIMKGHDGAVDVESARGVGTSFVLYFPTSDTAAATSRRPQPPARAVPGTRVLHVDDEPSVASVITRGLTRLGHVVSSFTDPREALDELRRQPHQYDVLLTDLAMPHISGLDLAAAVLAIRPDLRIVITTGHAAPEEVARCQALGIHEVVAKPPVLADLSRAIAGRPGDG